MGGWGRAAKRPPAVGAKLCHKIVAAVQPHALGVGEHPAGGCCAAGQVAQRHGRGDLQHDVGGCAGRFLAGVDGGGEFRVAEQVHHTVVADAVAAAEFPVGVVVGHAPAKAARHARLGDAVVQHSGVVQRLHQTVRFIVKGLGGEVLAAEFADEVALAGVRGHGGAVLAARAAPGVGIIVVGVNVLQQLALAGAAGARRGAGGVQPVDGLVGTLIKGLVVGAAADACTPQKDAGMVAVLAHHLPAVLQRLRLPYFIADVLPAGHLGEYQQTQLVAGVQKRRTGGRIAGAHGVAAQLLFSAAGRPAAGCCPAWRSPDRGSSGAGQGRAAPPAVRSGIARLPRTAPCGNRTAPFFFVQHPVGQTAGAGADEPHGQGVQGGVL